MVLEKQLGNGCTWIDLDLGKLNKLEDLSEIYGLDKETIEYALDRNERAHMDYHRESGTVTFIYNVLDVKKDKAYYETFPMTFIVEHRRLITISNTKNAYVIEQMTRYLESHDTLSIYKFLLPVWKSSAMPTTLSSSRWIRVRTRSMVSCVSGQLRKIFCPFRLGDGYGLSYCGC